MRKMIKSYIEKLVLQLPYIGKWRKVFNAHSTPGHFYSPIPNIDFIKSNSHRIFIEPDNGLEGINLNSEVQLSILTDLSRHVSTFPYHLVDAYKYRFNLNNIYYTYYDALNYFTFLLKFKPKRVYEVGSGYSSALLLDVNEYFLNSKTEIVFIEPFPEERLLKLKRPNDKFNLITDLVQNVRHDFFSSLEAGDFLFIDTSHVSKIWSDVNYIFFEIFPRLKAGVIIHLHDVHYPFEYPKEWIYKGFAWNEAYFLRSFLMYNTNFDILFMNSYLNNKFPIEFKKTFNPYSQHVIFENKSAGSIWIVKK